MRFSRWTHVVICLSLETLTSVIRTRYHTLVELIDLVKSVIISNDLTQMVNFPVRIPNYDSHSPVLLDLFLLTLEFLLQWLSLHWQILIMLLSQFPLTFYQIHNGMPRFIALLMNILVPVGRVFVIIWEMFHERISLNSVLLLLLRNFVSGFRLELMYISLIVSIRPTMVLHGFQLLVRLR